MIFLALLSSQELLLKLETSMLKSVALIRSRLVRKGLEDIVLMLGAIGLRIMMINIMSWSGSHCSRRHATRG